MYDVSMKPYKQPEELMVPTMVRLPPALRASLERIAEQEDRTVSAVIRRSVAQYVKLSDRKTTA